MKVMNSGNKGNSLIVFKSVRVVPWSLGLLVALSSPVLSSDGPPEERLALARVINAFERFVGKDAIVEATPKAADPLRQDQPAGRGINFDYLTTYNPTWVTFGPPSPFIPPIPNNFFDPGSDPFQGQILLTGLPIDPGGLGTTDTIIRRPSPPVFPADPPGTMGTVPIELVQLSLVSVQPIT
ncbi:MAG: hypothetical protein AABZ47_18095, partial [Planctomycetota bacterium]